MQYPFLPTYKGHDYEYDENDYIQVLDMITWFLSAPYLVSVDGSFINDDKWYSMIRRALQFSDDNQKVDSAALRAMLNVLCLSIVDGDHIIVSDNVYGHARTRKMISILIGLTSLVMVDDFIASLNRSDSDDAPRIIKSIDHIMSWASDWKGGLVEKAISDTINMVLLRNMNIAEIQMMLNQLWDGKLYRILLDVYQSKDAFLSAMYLNIHVVVPDK